MILLNPINFLWGNVLHCIVWVCLLVTQADAFLPKNVAYPLDWSTISCTNTGTIMTTSIVTLYSSKSSSFFPQPGTTASNGGERKDTNGKIKSSNKKKNRKRGKTTTKLKMSKKGVATATGRAISDEQLVEHVASQYTTGPRGQLDERMRNLQSPQEAEHSEYLRRLSNCPALVLNADYKPLSYLPLSVWSWQDAIKSVLSGKATVVETYPEKKIRAANLEIPLPCVISLNEYVPAGNKRPAFTRRNVFLRDEYTCQYCKNRFHTSDLSLDHVHPRCMGGVLSWENAVTSCLKCNGRKGSLTVQQLRSVGMKLSREPFVPTQYELAARASRMVPRRVHPVWAPYLGLKPKPVSNGDSKHSSSSSHNEEGWFFEDAL